MSPPAELKMTDPVAGCPWGSVTEAVTVVVVPSLVSAAGLAATVTVPADGVDVVDPEQAQTSTALTTPRSLRARFTKPPARRRGAVGTVIEGDADERQFSNALQ